MKLITHIYAIIVCSMLFSVIISFLIIGFPFAIIVEVITFIKEAISDDGFEHGVWIKLCRDCFMYIKHVYCLIINSPYEN
jgi:hypothetical protein